MNESYKSLEAIATSLGRPQPTENGFDCLCPCHPDTKPSLSISCRSGKFLWKCQRGCSQSDVGNKLKNLGLWTPSKQGAVEPTAIYPYHDELGNLLYEQCRFQSADGRKSFRFRRPANNGGHVYNLQGVERVPYRLPKLRAEIEDFWGNNPVCVYVPEGEKDVDNLIAKGFIATTNPGGAGNWRREFTKYLKGATQVYVLPDNDEPGRKHAEKVAAFLFDAGIPVKIVNLPGVPPSGDVSDWFAGGGTKEQLLKLCEQTALYEPSELSTNSSSSSLEDDGDQLNWHDRDSWSTPILFGDEVTPEILPDEFPPWLRDYILAVAKFTQTPPAMATMLAMAVVATCLQRSFVIRSDESDFLEPLSVWVLAIMPPASRKSAVISLLTKPLVEWEKKKGDELRPIIERNRAEREMFEQQIEAIKKECRS